jgi:signal transduction histidine kinase
MLASAPGVRWAPLNVRWTMADHLEKERDGVARLAEEHAALRRVATLVARGVPSQELFATVNEEVGQLLSVDIAGMARYEDDTTATVLAAWSSAGDTLPSVGSLWALAGKNVPALVAQTGRPARIESADASGPLGVLMRELSIHSLVGTPIVVEGRLWGVMVVCSTLERPLPADTEARLASFTELVATAIANAASRAALARLAEEQAALRRVATLVARAAPPERMFEAVTKEVAQLLDVERASMGRYESDGTMTFLTSWTRTGPDLPTPSRWVLGGKNVPTLVAQTGRPARLDSYADASGPIGLAARERGLQASVGTPIIVEGRLWGVMSAIPTLEQPLPPDTEARLTEFTELLATAIANAESRDELAASRARIITAADQTRRRIERDLHDGAQQRLVSLGLELRAAQAAVPPNLGELEGTVSRVAEGLAGVQEDLREIARGIHPAILAEGGLGPALKTLARRSRVPVELDVRPQARLAERIEVAAYYVVAETLTNVAKHAHASVVHVEAEAADGILHLEVRDDGEGGADSSQGSGLAGLHDRVEALGGTLTLQSMLGAGTSVHVELPLET